MFGEPSTGTILKAEIIRGYRLEGGIALGMRQPLNPEGVCRILNKEGFKTLGPLSRQHQPFNWAVENAYGKYAVLWDSPDHSLIEP
jgi:hypothetical protein